MADSMKAIAAAAIFLTIGASVQISQAAEPDGLVLPPGFHATVVNGGLGTHARHLAVRANGDVYVSTLNFASFAHPETPHTGIIALRPGKDGKLSVIDHFGGVDNGTGIAFYHGALYAASPTAIWRYSFAGKEAMPSTAPERIVDGMPTGGSPSHGVGFDGKGHMFVSVAGVSNNCLDEGASKNSAHPIGRKPCPELANRAGIWRFDAQKHEQKFPTDGEQIATGIRDMEAVEWSSAHNGLYAAMQGRNGVARALDNSLPSTADDDIVAEELHRVDKGTDFGWPYTYYDFNRKTRMTAPEYGGDGKTPAGGKYSDPVAAFPAHASPLDIAFYDGKEFPKDYRGGVFVALHGALGANLPGGRHGYEVKFVPFDKTGKTGAPQDFIEGFAGPDASYKNAGKAMYRPIGLAVAPDGSLYVLDGSKGRMWRITFSGVN
jgi:glucose/arabinose dehydrogenase